MERVIKNLVEYDKRGRRLVEEAEEERRSVLAHMEDYKKELAKQYHEREQEKVEGVLFDLGLEGFTQERKARGQQYIPDWDMASPS